MKYNEQEVLVSLGKVSHEIAIALAETEYDKFPAIQDQTYKSDFDKLCEASKSLKSDEDDNKSNE